MNDQASANVYSHLYAVFIAFLSEQRDRTRLLWYNGTDVEVCACRRDRDRLVTAANCGA